MGQEDRRRKMEEEERRRLQFQEKERLEELRKQQQAVRAPTVVDLADDEPPRSAPSPPRINRFDQTAANRYGLTAGTETRYGTVPPPPPSHPGQRPAPGRYDAYTSNSQKQSSSADMTSGLLRGDLFPSARNTSAASSGPSYDGYNSNSNSGNGYGNSTSAGWDPYGSNQGSRPSQQSQQQQQPQGYNNYTSQPMGFQQYSSSRYGK